MEEFRTESIGGFYGSVHGVDSTHQRKGEDSRKDIDIF